LYRLGIREACAGRLFCQARRRIADGHNLNQRSNPWSSPRVTCGSARINTTRAAELSRKENAFLRYYCTGANGRQGLNLRGAWTR
jgi:hypothetical protein